MAHYFPYDVKLRLLGDSRSFLANQKARNAIVGAENLLKENIYFNQVHDGMLSVKPRLEVELTIQVLLNNLNTFSNQQFNYFYLYVEK